MGVPADLDLRQTGQSGGEGARFRLAGGSRCPGGRCAVVDDDPPAWGGGGSQLLDRAGGNQLAGADDDDPVAQALNDVELVRGEERGDTGLSPLTQDLAHDVHGHRVQAGEGLVQDEQGRVSHEGRGQLDTLLVTE